MRQFKIAQSITTRDVPSVANYLKDISKEELITPEEEVQLARRIKEGDEEAREKLIKANLRFVISVAKQYQNNGVPFADLVSEGNLGLIKAAENFDETKGFKFISYAVWWIRQSILKAISEQSGLIRIPANQVGTRNKLSRAMSRFEQENQRPATSYELSQSTGIDEEKVAENMKMPKGHSSIDARFSDDEDGTLLDVLANEDSPAADEEVNRESLKKELERALSRLSDREREILYLNFGMNGTEMTLEEIGEQMNLTRERVRQIKEKALKKLKASGANLLKVFL